MFCDWAGNARGLQPPLSRFAFRAALGRRFAFHDLDGVEGIEGLVLCEVRG